MTEKEIIETCKAVVNGNQIHLDVTDMDELMGQPPVTKREAIRLVFQQLGVEIEFSGKAHHEKGVVIDMDTDQITAQNLNPDVLRFGQTVVRVK